MPRGVGTRGDGARDRALRDGARGLSDSWLRGRVCAGEAREGLEGVLLRALARSIGQMLRCHELRVEARGPARPGPARLQRTPRSGAARGRSRGPASTMAPQDMAHAEQRAVEKWC